MMTRHCEINEMGFDPLPCFKVAKHYFQVMPRKIGGSKNKFRVYLCDKHHAFMSDKYTQASFLDSMKIHYRPDPDTNFEIDLIGRLSR